MCLSIRCQSLTLARNCPKHEALITPELRSGSGILEIFSDVSRFEDMSVFVTKELAVRSGDEPEGGALSTAFPDDLADARIRIVKVGEPIDQAAFTWWPLAFPNCQLCACSESYIANISPSRDPYDILLMAGPEPERLTTLLRCYLPVLGLLPKIAALERSTPHERTQLLNAGFDDVFTAGEPVQEARSRLTAIWRRYRLRGVSLPPSRKGGASIDQVPGWSDEPLSRREASILKSLFAKSPSPVPITELQSGLSFARSIKTTSLRVQICTLRKKLKDGVHIQKMTTGYALIVDEGTK